MLPSAQTVTTTRHHTFFWRRLYSPGSDVCRVYRRADGGWDLRGTAVFHDEGRACDLGYEVNVDARWVTQAAHVRGHCGERVVDLHFRAGTDGRWRVGQGGEVGADTGFLAASCPDFDLNFSPATNMIAIRRMALQVGQQAQAPAAWLSFPDLRLQELPQVYRRLDAVRYQYDAPTVGYSGVLEVCEHGAVVHYPELFARSAS
jgi:hypothetical protein